MCPLTKKQINFIQNDISQKGLKYEPLLQEMLDHICVDVENYISQGYSFKQAYQKISCDLNSRELKKLENQTILLLNLKFIIMKKLMFVILGFLILSFVFKTFQFNGYLRILDLSFIIISLAYLKIGIDLFKDKRKKLLNPILGSLSIIAILFTLLPMIAWLIDEFTALIEVRHNVYPHAVIGFYCFIMVCFIKFITEINSTENRNERKGIIILLCITVLYILFMPLGIAKYFNYHIELFMPLAKIHLIISIVLIIPYLFYTGLIKNKYIAILVLVGLFFGLNGLNKNYLFSTSFSKNYQSEILIEKASDIEVNSIELKAINKGS